MLTNKLSGDYDKVNFHKIGKRIKEERRKRQLTQERLAELVDVTPAFIGHIERGERSLSLITLIKISNCLGVTIDYLLSETIIPKDEGIIEEFKNLIHDKPIETRMAVMDILKSVLKYL
ncbi:MAG: helix-turn-helix transcriptional regulator [Clostridia bacterium]|nr:helix-turn-helix transcriptional regulator [Clostridia bacterium]